MNYLQEYYHGIDVHTNSWSGLDGIVLLMHTLIVVIYLVATVFIMVSVALISGKLLQAETGNMAVYKSIASRLRMDSFIEPMTIHTFAWGLIKQFEHELKKKVIEENLLPDGINGEDID